MPPAYAHAPLFHHHNYCCFRFSMLRFGSFGYAHHTCHPGQHTRRRALRAYAARFCCIDYNTAPACGTISAYLVPAVGPYHLPVSHSYHPILCLPPAGLLGLPACCYTHTAALLRSWFLCLWTLLLRAHVAYLSWFTWDYCYTVHHHHHILPTHTTPTCLQTHTCGFLHTTTCLCPLFVLTTTFLPPCLLLFLLLVCFPTTCTLRSSTQFYFSHLVDPTLYHSTHVLSTSRLFTCLLFLLHTVPTLLHTFAVATPHTWDTTCLWFTPLPHACTVLPHYCTYLSHTLPAVPGSFSGGFTTGQKKRLLGLLQAFFFLPFLPFLHSRLHTCHTFCALLPFCILPLHLFILHTCTHTHTFLPIAHLPPHTHTPYIPAFLPTATHISPFVVVVCCLISLLHVSHHLGIIPSLSLSFSSLIRQGGGGRAAAGQGQGHHQSYSRTGMAFSQIL